MYRPINAIRFYEKPINFGGFCNAVERVLAGGLEDNAQVQAGPAGFVAGIAPATES